MEPSAVRQNLSFIQHCNFLHASFNCFMQPLKILFLAIVFIADPAMSQTNTNAITQEVAFSAEKLIGLDFSKAKL